MEAQNLFRSFTDSGDFGDRDGGCVGGEYCLRTTNFVQFLEDLMFNLSTVRLKIE